jgi:ABC-type transport system substrate-binding protein
VSDAGPLSSHKRHGGFSRRQLLRGAASIGAASVAALAVGCEERNRRVGTPTPGSTATPAPSAPSRGGILRTYNFDALTPETLDPHLLRGGPMANVHSAIFSKLVRFEDEAAGTIEPDLAASLPEQPDELTYVFTLRHGVTFHASPRAQATFPSVAGRALTANDVKFSIERQFAEDGAGTSRFPRRAAFNVIERVTAIDEQTVRLTLKMPVAPLLAMMAERHAAILAPETIDLSIGQINAPDALIGSGPFYLESFEAGFAAKLRRNDAWFAARDRVDGPPRPYLDGYDAFLLPQQDAFQRDAFERGFVDATEFVDPAAFDRARTTNLEDIVVEERDAGGLLASRLLTDRAPFLDDRARRAVHLAVDRRALASLLYPPAGNAASARLSGPIPPALERWAIHEGALRNRPGYGDERVEAVAEARALWSAAQGDAPVTELRIVIAGAPRTLSELAAAALRRQINEAIGVTVVTSTDPTGDALIASGLRLNVEGAAEGAVSFTFAFEDGGVDLDDSLYGLFRSGAAGNTFRLQDATLDAMLDKQRGEFDAEERHDRGIAIQDYLLAHVNARLEYLAPVRRRLTWGYVRQPFLPLWYGNDEKLANVWLDTSHPAWGRRRA